MSDEEVLERLARLESRVEEQRATIESQRERIAQLERQRQSDRDDRLVADGTSVKVLGELDATDGTGVVGRATGSGQTYGVRGEASSTSGYGLSTPDDAEVGGTADLAAVGGGVTGGKTVTDLLGAGVDVFDGSLRVNAALPPSASAPANPSTVRSGMAGSGTSSDPYVITTDQELQAMSDDRSAHYVLGRDINASLTGQWNSGNGFDPVSDGSTIKFSGSFDGRGHAISGLTIARSGTNFASLFGVVAPGTTVENVRLADVDITGNNAVAGLAGANEGTVQRVAVGGSVTGDTSNGSQAGGIVGNDQGTLRQSIATASVSGNRTVGGLVGKNRDGTVELSIAVGSVNGNTDVGGIAGENLVTIQDAYWDTDATGQSAAIGAGTGSSNDLTGLTTSELQGSDADSNLGLLDFTSVWTTRPSDYPIPKVLVD